MTDGAWAYDEAPHICEAHPGKAWPHEHDGEECAGPGVPIDTRDYFTGIIDIVFDGPPGPEAGRFVEVENKAGASIGVGHWIERGDGMWALRIPTTADEVRRGIVEYLRGPDAALAIIEREPRTMDDITQIVATLIAERKDRR